MSGLANFDMTFCSLCRTALTPCWAIDAASPWDQYSFSMCYCLKESSQPLNNYRNSQAGTPWSSANHWALALIGSPESLTLWHGAWRIHDDNDVSIAGKITMWGHLNESCVRSCACWQICMPLFLIQNIVCCFKPGNWLEKCWRIRPFASTSFDSIKSKILILSW